MELEWWAILLIVVGSFVALLLTIKLVLYTCVYKTNPFSRNIKGKVVIVTGGTSGVGRTAILNLVKQGAVVIFTGRSGETVKTEVLPEILAAIDPKSDQSTIEAINRGKWDEGGNFSSGPVKFRRVDFSSLGDVKRFAEWVIGEKYSVDTLLNNAGLIVDAYKETADKIEWTIGVNHFSHLLLTDMLMKSFAEESRVINVSSMVHNSVDKTPGMKFDWKTYFEPEKATYSNIDVYSRSKLANVFFTDGLQSYFDRLSLPYKATSLHPGVVRTNFFSNLNGCVRCVAGCMMPILWIFMKSPDQGAETSLYCVHQPFAEQQKAGYYSNCGLSKKNPNVTPENVQSFMKASAEHLLKAGYPLLHLHWQSSNPAPVTLP
jgi:retinol dehydrogenase-12